MQPEGSMDAAGGSGTVVPCSLGAAGMQRDRAAPAPLLQEPREGGAGDAAGHSAGAGRALQVRECSTNAPGRSDPANLQEVQWGKPPVQADGVRQRGAVGLGVQHRHSWMQWGHSGDAVGPWQQAGVLQWGALGCRGPLRVWTSRAGTGGAVGPRFSSVRRFGRESASGDAAQHTVSAVGNAVWCREEASGHSGEQWACCEGRSRDAEGTTVMLWGWGLGAAGRRGCSRDAVWVKWVRNKEQQGCSSAQWG